MGRKEAERRLASDLKELKKEKYPVSGEPLNENLFVWCVVGGTKLARFSL